MFFRVFFPFSTVLCFNKLNSFVKTMKSWREQNTSAHQEREDPHIVHCGVHGCRGLGASQLVSFATSSYSHTGLGISRKGLPNIHHHLASPSLWVTPPMTVPPTVSTFSFFIWDQAQEATLWEWTTGCPSFDGGRNL